MGKRANKVRKPRRGPSHSRRDRTEDLKVMQRLVGNGCARCGRDCRKGFSIVVSGPSKCIAVCPECIVEGDRDAV